MIFRTLGHAAPRRSRPSRVLENDAMMGKIVLDPVLTNRVWMGFERGKRDTKRCMEARTWIC